MADYIEIHDSGDVDSPEKGLGGSHTKIWKVMGEPSSGTAIAGVRAIAPLAVIVGNDTLVRQNVSAKPFPIDNWEVTVTYGGEDEPESEKRPEPGFWKLSFSTGGGKETVRFAPLVARYWNSSFGEAPASDAINFDGKEVKGVEIPAGELSFEITAYYDAKLVTPQFAALLASAVGFYNSDKWLGFPAGEIRFEGSDGECDIPTAAGQRVQPIALKHKYTHSFNETGIKIAGINTGASASGGPLGGINKLGWQYLSVREMQIKDDATGQQVAKAKHVYVHDPHYTMAFAPFFGFGG